MKKTFLPLLALVTAFATASPAMAEVRAGAFTVSPFVGGYTFDGIEHLNTNVAAGLKLGYNLTKNLGAEASFTYVPLRSTTSTSFPLNGKGDLYGLRGDILYHFMTDQAFVPFVMIGGGWSYTKNFYQDNADATLDYGVGAKYFLNDWIALRGDVNHIFSFHTSNAGATDYWQNFEYTVGLSFQFGGTRPAAVAVAAEKPAQEAMAPAPPPQAEKPEPVPAVEPAPVPAPVAEPALIAEPALVPAPVEVEKTIWLAKKNSSTVWEDKIEIIGLALQPPNALEIVGSERFNYQIITLSQPSRLVIDIPNAVNSLGVDAVEVHKIGIATVRIASQGDFLRIVLDAAEGKLLPYRVEETSTGIKILMTATEKKR